MLSLYEILKASKTGIAPDMWTALAGKNWGGTGSGAEIKEITGIPPLSFRADGTPLIDYLISGNMEQSGTPTPTTPIQPQETGDRTGNLLPFDDKNFVITAGNSNLTIECKNGNLFMQGNAGEIGSSQVVWKNNFAFELEAGTYYCNSPAPLGNGFGRYIKKYDDNTTILTSTNYIFILSEKTKCYLSFYIYSKNIDSKIELMLNEGSTALPYEPYGCKIPVETSEDILINSLTSQEHNGLTLTKNSDGSVRVQGTATANVNFCLCNNGYSLTTNAYQIIENGVYYIGGGIEGNEEGKFFLSARYDDAIGGAPSQMFRIPYGENIRIDNSNGAYKYLAVYIAVWSGQTVDFTCKPYLKSVSATTPIYLGEVPTTRRVKKVVFKGSESWTLVSGTHGLYTQIDDALDKGAAYIISSHYRASTDSTDGSIRIANNKREVLLFDNYASADEYKAFLAQQYANGTPITIWYVLATPETAVVNEPLRKIGDYADTVSYEQAGVQIPTNRGNTVIDVETTLKPSEMYIKYQE